VTNDVLYWRNKYRDLNNDKRKIEEKLNSLTKQLEKMDTEKTKLVKDLETVRTHYSHFTDLGPAPKDVFYTPTQGGRSPDGSHARSPPPGGGGKGGPKKGVLKKQQPQVEIWTNEWPGSVPPEEYYTPG
jgi:hypothetical protein